MKVSYFCSPDAHPQEQLPQLVETFKSKIVNDGFDAEIEVDCLIIGGGAAGLTAALAAIAYRETGFGINAGQVAGAVVASLPCTNCEEALVEGLTKMLLVPREKWEGLVL